MKIGLLSDAHGNTEAFNAGLKILKANDVAEIYFLGDAIGYIPNVEIVRQLQEEQIVSIKGNHELMMLTRGYEAQKEQMYQLELTRSKLTNSDLIFLENLPESVTVNRHDLSLYMIHGSPAEPVTGYVYPDTPLENFQLQTKDVTFMGNTHYPFIRQYKKQKFINTGSCGLPRDNIKSGSVCVYDCKKGNAEIIRYDITDIMHGLLNNNEVSLSLKKYLKDKLAGK